MNKNLSPYYPPRARWHSALSQAADGIRRRVGLDAIHLGDGLPGRILILGLSIPGLAFYLRGQKRIGQALVACGALLAVVFIIWLGYPLANMAFGLLLSLHVTSILFLFSPWLAEVRLPFRMGYGMGLLALIGLGVYGPLRDQLQEHWWMPLRVNGRVVVVQRWSSARSVHRGEWIAYSISGGSSLGIAVGDGFGLGPVLAVSGDRIRFSTNGFEINGVHQAPLPHMPVAAEFVVLKKHWFLWPELDISGHGNMAELNLAGAMLQLAIVSETQLVGKPYRHWFGRRQTLL